MSEPERPDEAGTVEPDRCVHPSMGVEEEFLLVDPSTGHPLTCNLAVVEAAEKLGVRLQLEFTQCQVETTSQVCWHTHELRTQLAEMRSAAADAAAQCGARLLAVGVPVLGSAVLPITDIRRYRTIASRFGYLAWTRGVCAGHVHVGVPDRETAVQVGNYLRPWLPALLALTANSPIHRGVDTGFASWRSIMLSRWPCSGPPPWFASVEHFDAVVEEMVECGVILDEGMINWDVRPSAHLPTVEVRVSDVPATVDETVLLATVVRALVMTALGSITRGGCAPRITAEALQAGYTMAAREGLTGHGIDLTSDLVVPAPDLLGLLVCHVRSALEELGEYRAAVAMLTEVLRCGNGASRQRRALRKRNHVSDVIATAAQSTLLVGGAALSGGAGVFLRRYGGQPESCGESMTALRPTDRPWPSHLCPVRRWTRRPSVVVCRMSAGPMDSHATDQCMTSTPAAAENSFATPIGIVKSRPRNEIWVASALTRTTISRTSSPRGSDAHSCPCLRNPRACGGGRTGRCSCPAAEESLVWGGRRWGLRSPAAVVSSSGGVKDSWASARPYGTIEVSSRRFEIHVYDPERTELEVSGVEDEALPTWWACSRR